MRARDVLSIKTSAKLEVLRGFTPSSNYFDKIRQFLPGIEIYPLAGRTRRQKEITRRVLVITKRQKEVTKRALVITGRQKEIARRALVITKRQKEVTKRALVIIKRQKEVTKRALVKTVWSVPAEPGLELR